MTHGKAYTLAFAATLGVIAACCLVFVSAAAALDLLSDDVPTSKVNAQCAKHDGVLSVPKTSDDLVALPGLSITVICRDGHYTRFDR